MRRDDFTAGFLAAIEHVRIEAQSQLQEVEVVQDLAYAWNYLDVCVTPRAGGTPKRRSGYTLTILRKLGGAWVIARDANLLAPGL
jgi:ketosteroid isomerase-like protein